MKASNISIMLSLVFPMFVLASPQYWPKKYVDFYDGAFACCPGRGDKCPGYDQIYCYLDCDNSYYGYGQYTGLPYCSFGSCTGLGGCQSNNNYCYYYYPEHWLRARQVVDGTEPAEHGNHTKVATEIVGSDENQTAIQTVVAYSSTSADPLPSQTPNPDTETV
jgi:hypothetical protein